MASKLEEIENPEFQTALEEAAEKAFRGYLYGGVGPKAVDRSHIKDIMEQIQHIRSVTDRKVDKIRRDVEKMGGNLPPPLLMTKPMRDITENLRRKCGSGGLVCPKCGEPDKGNTLNGKPICMICMIRLLPVDKVAEWVEPPEKPKKVSTFNELEDVVRKR